MKLLWVGHFVPYPPRGGAPQRSYHLLKETAREVDVHFAGLSLRGHQPDRDGVRQAATALGIFCKSVEILPTDLRSRPIGKLWSAARALGTGRSYGETWLDYPASRRLVSDAIARHRPDIIHVDSVMIADLIPAEYGGPAILNHHNVESHMMQRRAIGTPGAAGAYLGHEAAQLRKLEQRSAGRFARHIVVSDLDGERLADIAGPLRWVTVANGVDVDYFQPQSAPEEPATLVFCGRMSWYPNDEAMCRFLEELWPEVVRRKPETRLRIVGMHPSARLQAM